jgi:magnesium transporter
MASGISEKVESSDTVWRISRARIPWLLIGLLGGILGAQVISGFEGGISKVPELAFFIPLIAAMGGNVGVQSAAIVVQSLAKGNDQFGSIWKKIRKETLVGLINGILLSIIIYLITLVFGTLIPLLLDKYKVDPALATGPFITTINDVLGLFIYLTIGMLLFNI